MPPSQENLCKDTKSSGVPAAEQGLASERRRVGVRAWLPGQSAWVQSLALSLPGCSALEVGWRVGRNTLCSSVFPPIK